VYDLKYPKKSERVYNISKRATPPMMRDALQS